MRWQFLAVFVIVLGAVRLAEADEFPYKAVITKHDTQVRSGPGKNYYATDKLDEGAEVEVYRYDPGGWCAIRPPDGSFSWVRARYLELGEDPLATVNADDVVARVGSSLIEARDVIQVHLDRGEEVELVDGDDEKPGSWRKIAPPSGEFRWVPLDAIERPENRVQAAVIHEEVKPIDYEPEDYVRVAFEDDPSPTLAPPAGVPSDNESPAPSRRRRMSHAALQQEIVDIDLEISTRAANDVTTWSFDDLTERAERALEGAPTALDRAAVRDIMTKIDRFEKLAERHTEVQIAQSKLPKSGQFASRLTGAPRTAVDTSRFDGMGRLTQVTSSQSNLPQYALVDSTGTVRYYVNAAPGVNLKAFLNKEVGVNGTRGPVAAKQRQVLNAQRITELPTGTKRL